MMSVEAARLAGVEGKPLRARKVVGSGMVVLSGRVVVCEQHTARALPDGPHSREMPVAGWPEAHRNADLVFDHDPIGRHTADADAITQRTREALGGCPVLARRRLTNHGSRDETRSGS